MADAYNIYILKNIALWSDYFLSCLRIWRMRKEDKDRALMYQRAKLKLFHNFETKIAFLPYI